MRELQQSDAIIAIVDDLSAPEGLGSPVRSAYEYLRNNLVSTCTVPVKDAVSE
jgi:hypothetical protein